MRKAVFGAAAAAFIISSPSLSQQAATGPEFTPERFRSHVAFLADDLLEGRGAGTKGFEIGARYVASGFEGLGLKQAVEGSWYQQVPLVEQRITSGRMTVGGRSFAHGEEVLLTPGIAAGAQRVEAPLVFAGYGIDAPALGVQNYKGIDARGKIVVVLSGYPQDLPSDVGAHLNSEKRRYAEQHGAVGLVTIRTNAEASRRSWAVAQQGAARPAMTWAQPNGTLFSPAPGLGFVATVDTPVAEALFQGAGTTLGRILADADKGAKIKSFALRPKVAVEVDSEAVRMPSPNVLAVLPGSDPAVANEYVLLMAHLDGLGVRDRPGEDDIHNGAMDNATGIATLLEVARAIANSGTRPRRPILFAAVTAEERGLLGAQYLARNPAVNGRVVSVVNLDMPVLTYDFKDVIAFGAEHSTMGPIVARAGQRMGIALSPDPMPQEGLFTRSDHYRFVQEGIPSVILMTGFANGGDQKFTSFLKNEYHSPKDDLNLPFDWDAGAKFARLNYLIAREIADAPQAPRWYSDSFFGRSLAPNAEKEQRTK